MPRVIKGATTRNVVFYRWLLRNPEWASGTKAHIRRLWGIRVLLIAWFVLLVWSYLGARAW